MIEPLVHLIDDDAAVLKATASFLLTRNFSVAIYNSAQKFLDVATSSMKGCVVTDARMNGLSGLELTSKLKERRIDIPTIIITAYADVSLVIEAIRRGAFDLLEKPFKNDELVKSIEAANARYGSGAIFDYSASVDSGVAALTKRENEVYSRLLQGLPNKIIAYELGVSTRTVETHRATIMSKMNASSLAELVKRSMAVRPQSSCAGWQEV